MKKFSDAHVDMGARIRKRRGEVQLTQQEVAQETELDVSYYGRIERGEVNVATANLFKIAQTLQIDPGDLVRGVKYQGPPRPRPRRRLTKTD